MIFPPFATRTLAGKIVAVIICTTLAATLALVPAIFFTLQSGMQGQRQRHLAGVQKLVTRLIEENRQSVRNYAVLFSTDRQLKDNLYYYAELAGEREHPAQAVRHLVESFGLAYIELGDRAGRVVVDAASPESFGEDKADDPLLRKALAGEVAVGILPYRDGFLLKAVAPIFHDEGQLIGTISTGMALDNKFADMIRALSGADITIADRNNRVIATTLAPSGAKADLVFPRSEAYEAMALPFADILNRPLGSVIIQAEDVLPELLRRTNATVIVVLLCIALVSIIATALILRRVLAPIAALRAGAERIGQGCFEHRLEVTSADEIGSLAGVFNAMAANLQRMRAVEEKLKHAERLASIGEFTAATAHELNNPIANIIGLAKVARKEIPEDASLAEDLELLTREADRCGRIVRDLLVYSRAAKPNREPVDIIRLLDEAVNSVRPRFFAGKEIACHLNRNPALVTNHRVSLESEHLPALPTEIMADPVQLGQVFTNLLVNAAQAIAERGEIRISVGQAASGRLAVEIADSGCGILPEHLDKIFYPFFTTKKTGEGTGLGLAVCYTIVQSHGGAITVRGREGGGSVFTVTLPTKEENE